MQCVELISSCHDYPINNSERGSVMAEAALAFPFVIAVAVTTISLLHFAYMIVATQYISATVLREGIVGPAVFGNRQQEYLIASIRQRAKGFAIDLDSSEIEVCLFSSRAAGENCSPTATSNPGDFVSVNLHLTVEVPFVGTLAIENVSLARNELWSHS